MTFRFIFIYRLLLVVMLLSGFGQQIHGQSTPPDMGGDDVVDVPVADMLLILGLAGSGLGVQRLRKRSERRNK